MRRLANLLLLAAVFLAIFGARLRMASLGAPDVPQWGPIVANAAAVALVSALALGLIGLTCRRAGGSLGIILVGGAVQVLFAWFASSSAAGDTWRWTAPWVLALLAAVWLPGAFSIARTAELSFRNGVTFNGSYRVLALVGFVVVALMATFVPVGTGASVDRSPADSVMRIEPNAGTGTGLPFVTVEARIEVGPGSATPATATPATATPATTKPATTTSATTWPDSRGEPVVLEAGGERIAPFGGRLLADGRLHRLNFRAPRGPFVVRASAGVALGPVYVVSRAARFAGKIIDASSVWLNLALALALAGAAAARRAGPWARWFGWEAAEARLLPLVLLLPYLALAATHVDTFAGGSDSSGYLNSARLLRHGHLLAPVRQARAAPDGTQLPASLFVPGGFSLRPGPALAPTYPPGLPLLIAAANLVLPERLAVPAVILLHLLAGIVLLYRVARRMALPPALATPAAAVLALCPVYLFMGLQPMSDVPALVWVLLAVSLALSPTRPLACGAAMAMAVLVRPSNALAFPVVLSALASSRGFHARRLVLWVVGGLPFAAALAFYNHRLYGAAFRTGYGNPAYLFSLEYLVPTLRHYGFWLPVLLTPLLPLALAFPFLKTLKPALRWLLAAWTIPIPVFYAFYSCTHETWWYLRFLLPAFPGLILALTLVLHAVLRGLPGRAAVGVAVAAVVVALASLLVADSRLGVLESGRGNRVYQTASAWLVTHAPPDALVVNGITAGALTYYTSFEFANPTTRAEARAIETFASAAHRPLYAVYFRFDRAPLDWFASGTWQEISAAGDLAIYRFTPRAP